METEDKIQEAIKGRRQKEIESQRNAILAAARKLAVAEGWPKVSIRKISAEIAYTPPVIYVHFKNKEAILIELELLGFRKLKFTLEEARRQSNNPEQQLLDQTGAFWDWAFQNAEVYQVMFNMEGIRSSTTNPHALAESAQSTLETLRQLHLFSTEAPSLLLHWWALVHGYVSLVMSGKLPGKQEQTRRELMAAVKRFAQGLSG
jgi:AcrR family transcriptional regulator